MGILSFDNFSKEDASTRTNKSRNSFKKIKESKSIENFKKKSKSKSKSRLNESSFLVGDDYKVKVTIDVPTTLIQDYIKKVEEESGKNALSNFTETELAEQMINYVVKQNLTLDQIPSSLSIGEEEAGEIIDELSDNDVDELENDFDDEIDDSGEEIDIDIEEAPEGEEVDTDEELEGSNGTSDTDKTTEEDLEFESDEIEMEGEEIELESESESESESTDDKEIEEEEETGIDDLYKRVGYNKYNNLNNPYYNK